jgi:hypothetical protein
MNTILKPLQNISNLMWRYQQKLIKDSKKINQDFELLTELYGVLIGEENPTETNQL